MEINLFLYVAVISFSAAVSEQDSFLGSKSLDEYVPCDNGWYYFREKCYRIGGRKRTERLDWDNALKRCRSYRGDLVSIHSQEEQDFIVSFLLLDFRDFIRIGLNDRKNETDFRWSDGSVLNYTNWQANEPSGTGDGSEEDCVHMGFIPAKNVIGQWNDRACDVKEAYICEKKAKTRKRSPNPIYCSSEKGKGWKLQSSCYHVVTEMQSWQDAERHCKDNYNGHLVTILDKVDDLFLDVILANIKEELWIGIKIQNQLQQKWSSGWYVSYNGFNKRQLNFERGTCVARKKRKEWITIPCSTELPFICEVSEETPPVLKQPMKGSHCPTELDDWRDLGGEYCYYIETKKLVTFYEASFDCKRRGGNLVSLHSKEESDMLHQFLKYVRHNWSVYIGLIRLLAREEEFAWTDGSALDYENWRHNEPDNEEEKCVEILGFHMVWNDVSCEEKRGYICSVKKISPNANFENEDGCASFCIAEPSHLYEMVNQSPDAKRLTCARRL